MWTYAASAIGTIAGVWLAVWLLMTGLDRLVAHFADSEWLDDNGLRLVVIPDRCGGCSAVGYHHAGCPLRDAA